jgi:aryl-alcohol dehydrogenase-like predicted oxidoreductase
MQKDTPTPPPASSSPASSLTTHFLELGPQHNPRLGLGLAALGRPGYINLGHGSDLVSSSGREVDTMRQHCWDVLDAAWALGIRYFDAARSYGRAEEFLAGWLQARNIPSEAVVVGSKWGWVLSEPLLQLHTLQHQWRRLRGLQDRPRQ